MRGFAKLLMAAAAITASVSASAASVFVSASSTTPTLLGTLIGGQTYNFTVTGVASLCGSCNNGGALNFTADGKPVGTLSAGYAPFSPNGLDHDPTGSGYGVAGPGFLIGVLLLSSTSTPTPVDFVVSGLGGQIQAASTTPFYGLINDSVHNDNLANTGYTFTFNAVTGGVPEPANWALMIGGFAIAGASVRRQRRTVLA